ncbi:MAG: hypothetical protein HOP30_11870 [Cyclobacteriaceae bacterium]|nr:hypothetical protein [Cyclobacteriaceae bacterium]
MKKDLSKEVQRLKEKYNLTDCGFDAECIYQLGDLSELLKNSLKKLLPDIELGVEEQLKNGRYAATIVHNGDFIIEVHADQDSDWLPEDFWELFDSIPNKLGLWRLFCSINPQLTGQATWYLCGTNEQLDNAKKDGLPIVFRGENIFEMDLSEYE